MRRIQIVPLSRKEEMKKYFYDYLNELSQFDPDIKFDENNIPVYKWYDCYWEDKDRYPFYLMVDDCVAGIAMIRELDNMIYDFSEFYVFPKYREKDNSLWFAKEITNLFQGQFVFSARFTNYRAIKFWNKFSQLFAENEYLDDDIWRSWTIRKIDSKTHKLNLNPIYFDLIKNGEKTLEGRLNDDKRKIFNVGDKIVFYKEPERTETMNAIILDKYLFNDFEEMADKMNKADLGFANKTKQEMIETYRNIYTCDDERKYGVVIFKIKTI